MHDASFSCALRRRSSSAAWILQNYRRQRCSARHLRLWSRLRLRPSMMGLDMSEATVFQVCLCRHPAP